MPPLRLICPSAPPRLRRPSSRRPTGQGVLTLTSSESVAFSYDSPYTPCGLSSTLATRTGQTARGRPLGRPRAPSLQPRGAFACRMALSCEALSDHSQITLKALALLLPPRVLTVTDFLPLARAGTLNLILVALHETYLVTALPPK